MKIFVLLFLGLLALGCEEAPGETISGVVSSDQPLTMPLSGKAACVGRLVVSRTHDSSGSSSGSTDATQHRWAPNATLTVDGKPLKLKGNRGNPSYLEFGESWSWNKSFPDKKPPRELWGWGHDSTFQSLMTKSGSLGTKHISVSEDYSPCGSTISVRAIRNGETLNLVDTNKIDSANAIKAFGGVFAGFFCCAILPMILLIGFVIRRSLKKAKIEQT